MLDRFAAWRLLCVLLLLAAASSGCHERNRLARPPPPPLPEGAPAPAPSSVAPIQEVVFTNIGGETRVLVEVADTEDARRQGLMFRDGLSDGRGMLFVFPDEQVQVFWMQNTRISLDMIFIDGRGSVVGVVERAEPMTMSPRSVDRPSRYVVEVNGGAARRHGIAEGTRVRFQLPSRQP